jgi:hypothetical protein
MVVEIRTQVDGLGLLSAKAILQPEQDPDILSSWTVHIDKRERACN